jgi:hypothetical protein
MSKKYRKKYSALAMKEIQMKNDTEIPSNPSQNGYHQERTNACEDVGVRLPLYTVCEGVN